MVICVGISHSLPNNIDPHGLNVDGWRVCHEVHMLCVYLWHVVHNISISSSQEKRNKKKKQKTNQKNESEK